MPSTPFRKPRHSLEAFDKLFERAFAPRENPALTPLSLSDDIRRPTAPSPPSPSTLFYSPVDPNFPISPAPIGETSLDPIWEEVMQTKERELASSPSKVKSLEGAASLSLSPSQQSQSSQTQVQQLPQTKKRVTKRRSSVNFRESLDGRNMLVTFDMVGVKKQDMHVSYRTSRLIVSWRVERTVERQDGDVVVREREVRRYSHTIPLPDGTKFEEVRASRDGQRLTLTLPNLKCVRADSDTEQAPDPRTMRTIPDIDTAFSGMSDYHSC
ncbi:hypothetical protein K466DRAFT_531995 [Polyporus arcularius HHB13444]|uniref:SHSP domain-containing protein n=1 Tax=Polyporus arcularius HHB13444 TaxID=1314778 RepID=A0A5C3NUU3_9APHY|nr:hypothetical protein K466DRAFT_531995 [Polyporus arcularius HHB13444]